MRKAWWVALAVAGCSSSAPVTTRPTAQVLPSPSSAPSAAVLASATPAPETSPTTKAMVAPSPTPSPTPAANDPSLGQDGFTVPSYTFRTSKNVVFSVVLPGHATEGYKWVLATGFDAKVASGTGQSRPGPKPEGGGNGVSAAQVFDFTAVGSGQTTLSFDLVMPSDPKKASVENRKFGVNVL